MDIIGEVSTVAIEPCVAAIGFFDGVHAGHLSLMEQVKQVAEAKGLHSALVTFPIHPRKVINPEFCPELLTTYNEKMDLLSQAGIDYCIVLNFTPQIAQLTALEFMTNLLKNNYQVKCLVIGYDHRFGHNRSEGFDDYCKYGEAIGMEVVRAHVCTLDTMNVSSSSIRHYLHQGQVDRAAHCLGYNYFLDGVVVGGYQVGRKIGFPTANLAVNDPDKLIPADGVYAVRVSINNQTYVGMLNIGVRPTVDNGSNRTIEVHILHFNADIYDQPIRISFVQRIRQEMKFNGVDKLIAQLHRDKAAVSTLLPTP